ncbi:prolyl 4-hydroxylase subunit alpha-1 isoform X1 [Hydra vulgaris]|uniref:Prolyl 4-hydroxylase subunit alpha-1 isoform X1 n=1 Tax=Hydra vulgaris TaxID=6087 RepID=A0ABM4BQB7_HYDVU
MLSLLLFIVTLTPNTAEIFTSMAQMENLVHLEKSFIHLLQNYVTEEEKRLTQLKHFLNEVSSNYHHMNDSDAAAYIANPVNAYLMLKRFNNEWRNLEKTIVENSRKEEFISNFERVQELLPSEEDYEGAIIALFRLQDTYKLRSSALAKGLIPGVKLGHLRPLNVGDIFEIGQFAYSNNDWHHATDWLNTALMHIGTHENQVTRDSVLDYLAYAEFKAGKVDEAYKHTKELAKLKPNEQRIVENLDYFNKYLHTSRSTSRYGDDGLKDDSSAFTSDNKNKALSAYEQLCRGEVRPLTKKEQAKMKCWYSAKDPVLKLKPQKVERVWVDPEIFILRDIISEKQINLIKEVASPMLRRATIQDPITGKLRHADYRISKSAWLSTNKYNFLQALEARTQATTGLDLSYAEQLQVANYGLGGHYEPHFDHSRENEDRFTDLGMGNRIATVLFYLSDVEAGGATVFTVGKTAVFPSKGDAVFWFNLKRNGKGNPNTRHAACPVLVGQKWVSNWWIHEFGQIFRRKCALDPNL